jgi:hypothetical protein
VANSFLSLNFKKNLKINLNSFSLGGGWSTSIGIVLKILKLNLKNERKFEKNKLLFLNYVFKYFIKNMRDLSILCKYFTLNFLIFIKFSGVLKKINITSLIFFIKLDLYFKKRVRRIKRRLKKRLLKYSNL